MAAQGIEKQAQLSQVEGQAPLKYYIFGHPVTMSPSPDIHNAGFATNGFAHRYERCDTEGVDGVIAKLREETCGGGSVTIPHKESVMPFMARVSEAAKVIGAVNTISKLADGSLYGDNTDWIGIKNQITSKAATAAGPGEAVCLLCGAGGTARAAAFALTKMQVKRVLIYNRTFARAEQLAKEFGFEAIDGLAPLNGLERLDFVVDTLPGATKFQLPDEQAAVLGKFKPVVLEAAYIPRQTAFVTQALGQGCRVVEGVEMLFEQGCAQCEIWTGKAAPRAAIATALLGQLFVADSGHPAAAMMLPHETPPDGLTREVPAAESSARV
mmetsp:Transcript_104567/g.295868  ORF Transcript_104567/g.295868 Transcript_104567/m.295868 type:complete len:326 (-) Transcript_104567:70-1047(-)